MRRVFRFSEFTQTDEFLQKCGKITSRSLQTHKIIAKPFQRFQLIREHVTQAPSSDSSQTTWPLVSIFTDKFGNSDAEKVAKKDLIDKVSNLVDEILRHNDDVEKIDKVLEEKGVDLFRGYPDGSAVVELLTQLKSSPDIALEVFEWRRRQLDCASPMTAEEYTKGIVIAGRMKNINLAIELFKEACNKNLKSTPLFNALMSAYTYNGLALKCQSLFLDLKSEPSCPPSIITYNILISSFGRLLLVDHMEETLREISDLKLTPTINTYKGLIAGYITAWMWEKMEKTYLTMKAGPIKPNLEIDLLMLRGYAHSRKLEKMEQIYGRVKDHVDYSEFPLIRAMICAYCKSSDDAKVQKVEELLRLIPESEYRPWLNVNLIRLYAEQDLLDRMEDSINEAFENKTYVTTVRVMRCIISSYFRHDAVDKLADFLQKAERAGWKICRSLYHCKMVMYSSHERLHEMERVLDEMGKVNMHCSKKTFWILFKAYKRYDQRSKLEQVVGTMCKQGYGIPLDAYN